ncbi:MAG: polysaccharide deacetylase family protein [Luteolibacter sp.]
MHSLPIRSGRSEKRPSRVLRFFALLSLGLASAPLAAFADTLPAARIAEFSGDRAGAISYTFDDNIRDQYTLAVPMMNEFGLKGTFFVIAGRTAETPEEGEQKANDPNIRKQWGGISWPELKIMFDQGHEIASHTWSHRNMAKISPEDAEAELSKAYEAIKTRIGQAPLTLAFPFNASSPEVKDMALKYHVNFRSYQVGASGKTTVDSLKKWADNAASEKKWAVLMLHGIARGYASLSDPEILREHFKYVKSREKDLWVDTFANISRYRKEHENAEIKLEGSNGNITCTLTSSLDPQIYNFPLTLVIETKGARAVSAKRDGKPLPAEIRNGALFIEASPDPKPITVLWK